MQSYGQPIKFVPLDEMNGNWNPYYGNPTAHKAAWIRIRSFFSAPNVTFFYDPNNDPSNQIASYYPGSQYVDGCALDGFGSNQGTWDTNLRQRLLASCDQSPLPRKTYLDSFDGNDWEPAAVHHRQFQRRENVWPGRTCSLRRRPVRPDRDRALDIKNAPITSVTLFIQTVRIIFT
jgi:hypothetical protein